MGSRIFWLVFVIFLHISAGEEPHARHRRAPSPGLFGKVPGLPSLPPLENIGEQFRAFEEKTRKSLETFIETIKDRIESLERAVYPDENNYWSESTTCGGVLVSQTGRISYKHLASYDNNERCVWTIRVNRRSKIKLDLTSAGMEEEHDYIAVTEVSPYSNETRTTKLNRTGRYVLDGPVILISFVSDWSIAQSGFLIDFEGLGGNVMKKLNFKHYHFTSDEGYFASTNLTEPNSADSQTFATIVINPENSQESSQLNCSLETSVDIHGGEECESASLSFFDFLERKSPIGRCCGKTCSTYHTVLGNKVMLATMSNLSENDKFSFNWTVDKNLSRSDKNNSCGGVISGQRGKISYDLEEYENNARCLWTISPTKKSKIKLVVWSNGLESGYDSLIASTVQGKFEMHNEILSSLGTAYTLSGPVIFISFYSDSSTVGQGFELEWEEVGEPQNLENDALYFDQPSGTLELSLASPSYQAVVLNPKYLDGSHIQVKLTSLEGNAHVKDVGEGSACETGLFLYGNDENGLSLAQSHCEDFANLGPEDFSISGGVFVLLYYSEAEGGISKVEFSWEKGIAPSRPGSEGLEYVNKSDNTCGDILIGEAGVIEYQLGQEYHNNARCTWIVQSRNYSKITLRMTKDGFESCCDMLFAAALDTTTGRLGENATINRETRVQSFNSSVVFVTFFSDPSVKGKGFRLEFTSGGKELPPDSPRFSHHIWHDTSKKLDYYMSLILADSNQIGINGDGEQLGEGDQQETTHTHIITNVLSPLPSDSENNQLVPINVTIRTTDFAADAECNQDILHLFEAPKKTATIETLPQSMACASDNTACPCPETPSKEDTIEIQESAFISVFRSAGKSKAGFSLSWVAPAATTEEPPAPIVAE